MLSLICLSALFCTVEQNISLFLRVLNSFPYHCGNSIETSVVFSYQPLRFVFLKRFPLCDWLVCKGCNWRISMLRSRGCRVVKLLYHGYSCLWSFFSIDPVDVHEAPSDMRPLNFFSYQNGRCCENLEGRK